MDFLELARKRVSTRHYLERRVDRAVIQRCIEAARLAPSACNSQPWSFVVVDAPELKKRLAAAAFSGAYAMNGFAAAAPVIIAVITGSSRPAASVAGVMRGVRYNLVDIGIACEHLVLQATQEGLGTCWIGWFNARAVKKVLQIPWHKQVDILISLGYPEAVSARSVERKGLDTILRYNLP